MLVKTPAKSPLSLRLLLSLCAVLALGSLAGYALIFKNFGNFGRSQSPIKMIATPQRTEVFARGRLEPEGEILAIAGPLGERIGRLIVQEGSKAQKGEILAYLDSYEEKLAQRDFAASQVTETRQRVQNDRSLRSTEILRAKTQVNAADTPQQMQIQAQQALIRRLEVELEDVRSLNNRFQRLWSAGAVSQRDYETKQLAVRQTTESLGQARSTLQQMINARTTSMQTAAVGVQSAQVELTRVDSNSGLQSAIENLKVIEAQLERTIIRSPRDGEVLKVFSHPGEAITNQGILQLGNTQQMYAVAEVYETDVSLVKLGQTVTVTTPAFSKPLTGTVTQIGRTVFKQNVLGDDPAAATDARVVEVKARLNKSQPASGLSRLQVDVRIHLPSQEVRHGSSSHP